MDVIEDDCPADRVRLGTCSLLGSVLYTGRAGDIDLDMIAWSLSRCRFHAVEEARDRREGLVCAVFGDRALCLKR